MVNVQQSRESRLTYGGRPAACRPIYDYHRSKDLGNPAPPVELLEHALKHMHISAVL